MGKRFETTRDRSWGEREAVDGGERPVAEQGTRRMSAWPLSFACSDLDWLYSFDYCELLLLIC
jgi:hypothetical protein